MKAKSEERASYDAQTANHRDMDDTVVRRAIEILTTRMRTQGDTLGSPAACRDLLRLKMAELEHEVFSILFLNSQNQLIEYVEAFRGTLTQTSVYPREVVKMALKYNAAGVILAHNHPSGVGTPSTADELLTRSLKNALALVDVRVLDHFIVAGMDKPVSFAELGYL